MTKEEIERVLSYDPDVRVKQLCNHALRLHRDRDALLEAVGDLLDCQYCSCGFTHAKGQCGCASAEVKGRAAIAQAAALTAPPQSS